MKHLSGFMKEHNLLLTLTMLAAATLCSFLFFYFVPSASANIALIYVLALVIIARFTKGYSYGIAAALFGVICINYFFTYPYFRLNFTLTGYPVTFLVMLAISLMTSALTSHMKQQSEILARHEKELMEAEKEKMRANLLRAVSHDLRTPLTSILGAITSLKENTGYSPAEKMQLLDTIYDDTSWLLHMVENLLSVTRIHDSTTQVHKSLEVVEEVVSEFVTRLKKRFPQAQVEVVLPKDFIMLPMDAMLVEQVLINLLENAVLHAGSTRPIRLTVTARESDVLFEIMDFGTGISGTLPEQLFDGKISARAVSADSRRGMGIGLSICKTIISAHNGTISAKNHAEGAVFFFTLPLSYTCL